MKRVDDKDGMGSFGTDGWMKKGWLDDGREDEGRREEGQRLEIRGQNSGMDGWLDGWMTDRERRLEVRTAGWMDG